MPLVKPCSIEPCFHAVWLTKSNIKYKGRYSVLPAMHCSRQGWLLMIKVCFITILHMTTMHHWKQHIVESKWHLLFKKKYYQQFLPHKVKMQHCISDYTQSTFSTFSYLGNFLKKLADNQCSSITNGSTSYQTYVHTTFYHWSALTWKLHIKWKYLLCLIFAHIAFLLCIADVYMNFNSTVCLDYFFSLSFCILYSRNYPQLCPDWYAWRSHGNSGTHLVHQCILRK